MKQVTTKEVLGLLKDFEQAVREEAFAGAQDPEMAETIREDYACIKGELAQKIKQLGEKGNGNP